MTNEAIYKRICEAVNAYAQENGAAPANILKAMERGVYTGGVLAPLAEIMQAAREGMDKANNRTGGRCR